MEGFFSGEKNMTLPEFGRSIGVEVSEISVPDVAVFFANGVEMPRRNDGIWWYENDGKICTSDDPKMAVVGAESVGQGKAIFYGAGMSTEVFNSEWIDYESDKPKFEKIRTKTKRGGE